MGNQNSTKIKTHSQDRSFVDIQNQKNLCTNNPDTGLYNKGQSNNLRGSKSTLDRNDRNIDNFSVLGRATSSVTPRPRPTYKEAKLNADKLKCIIATGGTVSQSRTHNNPQTVNFNKFPNNSYLDVTRNKKSSTQSKPPENKPVYIRDTQRTRTQVKTPLLETPASLMKTPVSVMQASPCFTQKTIASKLKTPAPLMKIPLNKLVLNSNRSLLQPNESIFNVGRSQGMDSAVQENNNVLGKNYERQNKNRRKKNHGTPASQSLNICAWEMNGNVTSLNICVPFLNKKCEYIKTGCKYLHSKRTFQWQFGDDKNWFNFHAFHSNIIERHFSDVTCDEVILPALNPKLCSSMKDMPIILGTLPLKVDFASMTLSGGHLKKAFKIRHLTTPSAANNDDKSSTKFKWFFKNDEGKWQLYEKSYKCEVSSEIIEKVYLNSYNVFNFKGLNFAYIIDFFDMVQINKSTRKVRAIRRRPQAIPTKKSSMGENIVLPSKWTASNAGESYSLILLNETSAEYKEVRKMVGQLTLFCRIERISRVQNELLWRQFENKVKDLTAKYQPRLLKVQKLFCCVDDVHFQDICKENLDFRMHKENNFQKFGQGAYFFNGAAAATTFFSHGHTGTKKLLVFEVIIGQTVKGNPSMTRPPENPLYKSLYDTTVDDVSAPTTYVKYNKQEYYPSYVLTLK